MSVAHTYPSQVESHWRNVSPFIARARARRVAGYVATAASVGFALLLVRPVDVNAGADALQSATLRSSTETTPPPPAEAPARKPVRVIPIARADSRDAG